MQEIFIERGTDYNLRNGKLTLYETNCECKDINFFFENYVITIMLAGHKTVISENLKFEFFPGTLFIPESGLINSISIPNASINNPTQCLVLELDYSFVLSYYESILLSESDRHVLANGENYTENYFLSNDNLIIEAFTKLYTLQLKDRSTCKEMIEDLIIKEVLLRIFNTGGIQLLKKDFEKSISNDRIGKTINYIKENISNKISVAELAQITGLGKTSFFKEFKKNVGSTPVDYILQERIRQSKIHIQKDRLKLKEIAYKCGFNSYEYFCNSFKKIENINPSNYKKGLLKNTALLK